MKGIVILSIALAFVEGAFRDFSNVRAAKVFPPSANRGFVPQQGGYRDLSDVRARNVFPPVPEVLNTNPRIIGGEEAERNSIPYQVALFLNFFWFTGFCGGSLISRRFVLTAAHCADGVISAEVILGAHNIREIESTQQSFISSTFNIHADWDDFWITSDIATIQLPTEATLNAYVQLATLPTRADVSNTFAGETAVATGWGLDSDTSDAISPVLRRVELTVITNDVCRDTFTNSVLDSTICTSGVDGRGTCDGDSGGPLTVNGVQVGVVSFGHIDGCETGHPSGYARTTSFLDWIEANSDVTIP